MFERYKEKERPINDTKEILFEQYWRYTSSLKQWFIGFGAGIVVLFATNTSILASVCSEQKTMIFILIFAGVATQVLLTIFNKITQFYIYSTKAGYLLEDTLRFCVSYDYSCSVWIEFLLDFVTLILFGWAAVLILRSL